MFTVCVYCYVDSVDNICVTKLCVYLFALENENSEVNSHWNTLHFLLGEFIKTIISTIVAVFPCPCILTAKKQKE